MLQKFVLCVIIISKLIKRKKGVDIMNLFYSDKNIRLRIRVSFENQERMRKYTDLSVTPSLQLKNNDYYTICFEYKSFYCKHKNKKIDFSYRDIVKIETQAEGIIIFLNNGTTFLLLLKKPKNTTLNSMI